MTVDAFKELRQDVGKLKSQLSLIQSLAPRQMANDQTKQKRDELEQILQNISQIDKCLISKVLPDVIKSVSQSKDEISGVLAPIFARAEEHNEEQFRRAQRRREHGYPPGKATDSIGDQLNWEQILFKFQGRKKLWIITNDTDYGSSWSKSKLLNPFLLNELCKISSDAEAFLFDGLADGIKNFASRVGVKAGKLPTEEQMREISREEAALHAIPTLDWAVLGTGSLTATGAALAAHHRRILNMGALVAATGLGEVPPESK